MSQEQEQEQEIVTFHRITESNEWEGENWYHYFLDEPGVYETLRDLADAGENENDYTDLTTVRMTWDEATRLTNLDTGGYMQEYWFGKVTNLEGLKNATEKQLYKGGIREFGEELFTREVEEEE